VSLLCNQANSTKGLTKGRMVVNPLHDAPELPTRAFGRYKLHKLLAKSVASMVWLAFDPATGREVMLTMPRVQPERGVVQEHWLRNARQAARLDHPHIAAVSEVGIQDHWPFIAVERTHGVTLNEWRAAHPPPAVADVATWVCDLLRGLAFAHEAGVAHQDPQLHTVLINERGVACLMAFSAAGDSAQALQEADSLPANDRGMAMDPNRLRARRALANRDLLACGLVLHQLLGGQPALDQPDIALAINRMAPLGRELVRLPWSTPVPVPEALRVIVNRCTSAQDRLRYSNARSLLDALTGWIESQADEEGGPVAFLLDRLHTVGHLPALPGLSARVSLVTSMEGQRTDQIAEHALTDTALTFELLRTLNTAQVQGTQVAGNGPVLTLRRIISLIGVNGVHAAANRLRQWPGPLEGHAAQTLRVLMERVHLAGHLAQALRPAGYDGQVTYLIAVLQNLGRLMVHYHFATEAEQIAQLMLPHPADSHSSSTSELPGMTEEAAAYAVLGVTMETLATAVARAWGLDDQVQHMVRRVPADAAVRKPDTDADVLRLAASAANEVVDAINTLAPHKIDPMLTRVAQRYARALGLNSRYLQKALQAATEALHQGIPLPTLSDRGPPEETFTQPAPL
jgi:eukaryotic-like serine/threonine-protein kinase